MCKKTPQYFILILVININGNLMQIANASCQPQSTTAASSPVQQIATPATSATQAGNIVMVIKRKKSLSLAQFVY